MSTNPVFVGIKGQAGTINLIPTTPPTFWQRLGKRLTWLFGWGLWTLLAFMAGWAWGAM
jgi:hypothetical protein